MTDRPALLVVSGEPSGDALAARVVRRLNVPCVGLGGPLLQAEGVEPLAKFDNLAAMGVTPVLSRAPELLRACAKLHWFAYRQRPRAALLVGFSEFNAQLGRSLRRAHIPVLWLAPPQIWAWRPARARRLLQSFDRLAVILPFEEALWRKHGADAHYVGPPALEATHPSREHTRSLLGMTPTAEYVALLPGSRPDELRRHLPVMLDCLLLLRAARGAIDARVILTPALPAIERAWATRQAQRLDVGVLQIPVAKALPGFDVAIASSGTVTLECVLAGVPPVIVYKTSTLMAKAARRLLEIPYVALPNIVLGEPVFPELLQDQVTADALCAATETLLDERSVWQARCQSVRRALEPAGPPPSQAVANLLLPWLS